jgi:hypothetical protein
VGRDPLVAGIFAGIAASGAHAVVDFDWQIPANAAGFVALCGLAVAGHRPQAGHRPRRRHTDASRAARPLPRSP